MALIGVFLALPAIAREMALGLIINHCRTRQTDDRYSGSNDRHCVDYIVPNKVALHALNRDPEQKQFRQAGGQSGIMCLHFADVDTFAAPPEPVDVGFRPYLAMLIALANAASTLKLNPSLCLPRWRCGCGNCARNATWQLVVGVQLVAFNLGWKPFRLHLSVKRPPAGHTSGG